MTLRSRIVAAVRLSPRDVIYFMSQLWAPWQGGLHRWGQGC